MVFGYFETHFEARDLPELSGKVAIVTGGNTGIGYETCLQLCLKKAKVYMASRTQSRAENAISKIKQADPSAQIFWLDLDLSDLNNVKIAAETFLKKETRLDILVNNAGVMACPYELTKDGVEIEFQTNHLGHFLLTMKLLPILKSTSSITGSSVRIVNVSSVGYKLFSKRDMTFDTLETVNKSWNGAFNRYGQSKLANVLFSVELNKRLKDDKIYVNAVHPGNVKTELSRGPAASYGQVVGKIFDFASFLNMAPYQGSLTSLYCAASPEIETKGYRGRYFVPYAKLEELSEYATDETKAKNLWNLSENILKEKHLL